jgi:hypothetical protein
MVFQHQPPLSGFKLDRRFSFGGPLLKGHARKARPVSKNFPMLVVFESKSTGGISSLLANERWVLALTQRLARRFRIDLKAQRVSSAKDLQLLIRIRRRSDLCGFFRSLGGLIPRKLIEKRPFRHRGWRGSFWKQRPFTWILHWDGLFAKIRADFGKRRSVVLVAENSYGHQTYLGLGRGS